MVGNSLARISADDESAVLCCAHVDCLAPPLA